MRCGGGLYVITEYLQMKVGRGGLGRMEDAIQLALEEEEGPPSQGRQAASARWKRRGNGLLPEPPEGAQS